MSCDIGHRHSLDPPSLWLWCRPEAAAPIRPLAWEPPYAVDAALKSKKKKQQKKPKKPKSFHGSDPEGVTLIVIIPKKILLYPLQCHLTR